MTPILVYILIHVGPEVNSVRRLLISKQGLGFDPVSAPLSPTSPLERKEEKKRREQKILFIHLGMPLLLFLASFLKKPSLTS